MIYGIPYKTLSICFSNITNLKLKLILMLRLKRSKVENLKVMKFHFQMHLSANLGKKRCRGIYMYSLQPGEKLNEKGLQLIH